MAAIAESRVSIRFFGDDLDPAEVTGMLGCEPTTQYRKGDVRQSATRNYARKYGAWILAAEHHRPEALDDQLQGLFARMTQDLNTWKALTTRYDANVFCGLFMDESNEGFSLHPKTLEALAARGLGIGFDVYDPTKADPVAHSEA
jgi:hypothetical protein